MSKRNRNRNRDQVKNRADSAAATRTDAKLEGAAAPMATEDEDELEISVGSDGHGTPAAASDGAPASGAKEAAGEVAAGGGDPAIASMADAAATMAAGSGESPPASVPSSGVAKGEALAQVIPFDAPTREAEPPSAEAAPEPPASSKPVAITPELQPLVDRIRAGRCVLWAGTALEEQAGAAGYRGAIGRLLALLPPSPETDEARALLPRRPLLVAGFVRRRLGDRFGAALREATAAPAELPEGVALLAQLPFRAVISTGYSDLFERAFTSAGEATPVYTPSDVETLRRDGRSRYLLKALGDPAREDTVLFSAQGLQAALADAGLTAAVEDLFRNRTVLFLGIDPALDVDLLLARLLPRMARTAGEVPHYAVLPGLSLLEREELEAYGLKVIDERNLFGLVRALREAVGDVKDVVPEDDDLHGWLALLSDEPERTDARDKLQAIENRLRDRGDHEKLLDLHVGLVEVEHDHVGRARRLREVAGIFEEKFGDLGKAFTALCAAYREDPAYDVADQIERLAEATGSWAELLSEFAQVAPSLPEPMRARHWLRVSRLYGDKLGHADYALQALDEALKVEPDNRAAQELRTGFLRKAEKWKELSDALGKLADGEESLGRKSELYLEQGDLLETRLHDGPGAAKAYRAALDADPGSSEALHQLEVLYRRRAEWRELVGVLDEKAKGTVGDEANDIRREAASIVAEKLEDRRGAIERYEALRSDGLVDLELLHALEKLYDAEGRTDDYLTVLAAEADAVLDDKEKLLLYRRLAAEWEERPEGTVRAAEYLERLLAINPKDEDALRAVERLYAAEKKWEALVDAYRRHLEAPGADKVALEVAIAHTFANEVNDPHRAIDAWTQVLTLQPAHDEALGALVRLYERIESWEMALAMIDRRVDQMKDAKDKEEKVRLLYESGRLAAERLGDVKQAEERYHRALEVDPTHVPSMTATVELYRKSGEFLRAAKLLIEAEAHTQNRLEKTRMLVEAGEIYDSLDQPDKAIELYLKAMQVDPEHVEGGARVADLLWKAKRFAEVVPILEMLTRLGPRPRDGAASEASFRDADKATQKTRWLRLGEATRTLGQNEKAARAYTKAAEIDPGDYEAQWARGQLLFEEQKYAEAREAFKAVLVRGESLKDAQRIELYYLLGECARKLGEIDKAKNFYAKALEIDPMHRPTILARIDVEGDDPKKIIEAKKALFKTAENDDERVRLLTDIGDLWLEKIEDPPAAVASYKEALAIRSDSRSLLHKLLDVFVEQKDWNQALEVLAKLTDLEQVPAIRAKLKFTRAAIYDEELGNKEEAIKLLGDAIEDDPTATRATERLEELLVQTENWKELTRFYRKAIKRIGPEAENDTPETRKERLRVWSALADTLLEKMSDVASAIPALEVAWTFDRGNPKRQEQLAELYIQAGPDYADKAIAAHQALLRAQHDRLASFRALRTLYDQVRQPEKALAVAYALAFLKKGDPADAEKVAELKKRPLQPVRRNLDEEMWDRNLTHPDENRFVGALFQQLLPTLAKAHGQPHKDVPLNRKDRVESTDPRSFAKGLRYVAAALNVTLPYECYVKYELREPLAIANCLDTKMQPVPCLVVGAPMLGDKRGERELIFELTKRLSYFRPERYLRFVLPQSAQLGLVIEAAISLGAEADREKPATGEIGRIAQDLKRALPAKNLEQTIFVGKKLKGQRGEALATAWLAAAELTATRAAFLLLHDLETTARFVAAEPGSISTHPTLHRLKELIHFSITEECFALRKHLGLMS